MKDDQIFVETELTPESFKELLPEFFEEINDDFSSLNTAQHCKDYPEIRRISHKIKGCSASYGAALIFKNALRLQELVIYEQFKDIKHSVNELQRAIHQSYSYAKKHFKIAE